MVIQLIHPPVYVNPTALAGLRPGPPLGIAYVAAALRDAGHTVSVLDALAAAPEQTTREDGVIRLGLTDEQILARIDPDAQALGLSVMFAFGWPGARRLIRAIKRRFPEKLVVCGGEHFTGLPEYSMEGAPIDYVVMGEGEEIAVALFERLARGDVADLSDLPGVCWRRGSTVVRNPRAERTRAVDRIPWPAWDLIDLERYHTHHLVTGLRYGRSVPILATRGCPYQCTYCSSPQMWTTRWYARDPMDVADEIEHYVRRYGADNFPFQDLTAIVKRDWIVAFCRTIVARGLDIRWQLPTGTRCEVVDEEVAHLLRASGCLSICYAPESGSERTRVLVKKRMKTDSLVRAVGATVRAGLNLTAFFVIGFPHDTAADLRASARLARRLARMGVHDVACAYFFPLPSTELFASLQQAGRVRLDDAYLLSSIFLHDRVMARDRNYCEGLSATAVTLFKYWIVGNFYLVSWLTHPHRPLRLLVNLFADREESKMDLFLGETKRRVLRALGVGRRRREPAYAPPVFADAVASERSR
jgi:radical SAM superfamily enzyme YgiQ (UPF0313 family)